MGKSQAEKEQKYYNKKLIKDSIKSENKKPLKIDWKELVLVSLGIFIGLTLNDMIGIERFVFDAFGRFLAEVFVIVIAIIVVKVIAYAVVSLVQKVTVNKQ